MRLVEVGRGFGEEGINDGGPAYGDGDDGDAREACE